MCKKQNNIYVVEVNMTEKTVEEITREAALKIIGMLLCQDLVQIKMRSSAS